MKSLWGVILPLIGIVAITYFISESPWIANGKYDTFFIIAGCAVATVWLIIKFIWRNSS
jgi:hypothetical protein